MKPKRKWLVRTEYMGSMYLIYAGTKPQGTSATWQRDRFESALARGASGLISRACVDEWESVTLPDLHLPPGGGPIEFEMRLVER